MQEKVRSNLRQVLLFFLFLSAGLLIYSNTFNSPFILDDAHNIYENPYIRLTDFSRHIAGDLMKCPSKYRPLANFSFALNYYFNRYDLFGYHLVNIFLHLITGVFLFLFFKSTLIVCVGNRIFPASDDNNLFLIPFFAAMLWMVHPLDTESVTYIVQRMAGMAAMFYILSLLLYVKGRLYQQNIQAEPPGTGKKTVTWVYYSGCLLAGACALACKQNAATLPLFILLYEWFFFQDLRDIWSGKRVLLILSAVFILGIVVLIYLGGDPADRILSGYERYDFNLFQRLMAEARVIIYYIGLFAFPHPARLNLDYDYPLSGSLMDPATTLTSLISILSLMVFAFWAAKRHRLASFCIFWFFGNLLIESSIIPLALVFEHRTYLPYMLPALLFVCFVFILVKKKSLAITALSLIIAVFSFWTYQRNSVWQSKVTLWRDCVKKSPYKPRTYSGLGAALAEAGDFEGAVANFKKAVQLKPSYINAHNNLGYALYQQGKYHEAEMRFRASLQLNPNKSLTHFRLAEALQAQGKIKQAVEHYVKAVQLNQNDVYAHYYLGLALYDSGRIKDAVSSFLNALALTPNNPDIHVSLGDAYMRLARYREAGYQYDQAVKISPNDARAYTGLGNAYKAQKKPDQAVKYYLKAIAIKPDNAEALNSLATVLIKQGKIDQAAGYLSKVLAINPDHVDAHINLGMIMAIKHRFKAAEDHLSAALKLSPGNTTAHNNMGALLAQEHRDREAIEHFRKVLQIDPNDAYAKHNLEKLIGMHLNERNKQAR